ncbi:hypothetical protein [Conexibacter sp. DBS9H8]|uniref:hypothetical protein n=1 Tax=Conexibacter sp. DBS9H8 TaxID=2937801 RepID=UPI00200C8CD2|nr:hypothetical protein [Conexibacter sp. DBS9H8]
MAKPLKQPRTLAEVAFWNLLAARQEAGEDTGLLAQAKLLKQAAAATATVAALAIADADGAGANGWPTQVEFAAYWKVTERHAQNEWAQFRRAFPTEESPDRLAKLIRDNYRAKLAARRIDVAASLPAEPFGIAAPALA